MHRVSLLVLFSLFESYVQATLEVIQGATPPRLDRSNAACHQQVFYHEFGNSYGAPYVGWYSRPSDCNYTTTIFNLSVISQGRQYDRLATLWLGDVEVWRTSTAMPTQEGIHWSFEKDMTVWDSILRNDSSQKVIFELNNVIDGDRYTGFFNVTLDAWYFNDVYQGNGLQPAEHIYAISTASSSQNATSLFSLPDQSGAVNLTLPRNAKTVVVSIMASGNAEEEFWFTNVPSEYVNTFPDNPGWLYGYSPFREVQLLIDGSLVGVSWPFPILFTGGVDPGAWKPIVGIDAYELPSFEVDVTPWVGKLTDGESHEFKLSVVGWDNATDGGLGPVGQNWWVSGSVFVWVDDTVEQTTVQSFSTGSSYVLALQSVKLELDTINHNPPANNSLHFAFSAQRNITAAATITNGGQSRLVSWAQNVSYTNVQNITNLGYIQTLAMLSNGTYVSSASSIISRYTYPMNLFSAYKVQQEGATTNPGSVLCWADRSKSTHGISILPFVSGISTGPGSMDTRQNVTSYYQWNSTIVEGTPSLDLMAGDMWYSSHGMPGRKTGVTDYSRRASEVNTSLTLDEESWRTIPVPSVEPIPYAQTRREIELQALFPQ
ncbi:peptide N-acetyl-beta-D-glucosaminyl asparaginase amidase A-domain-containing protein [Xylariaceae sp. FL1019]|nr:peptide N-acetyl-beta-D-glucosaminyl asparaginase amidase A-domain-containing protein [Xylariaceae sp. FL1019]